ncbi:PilZ domain-containing protein [Endozoicomonas lisbonensis]|uniref:PilZ domain-containing protein n=1 Tax=Endozoicomonas lisbonensis TaxID=3120522 RepID=UPI0033986426
MTDTVLEKRRFPRKLLEEPAEVLDNDTGQLLGILEDVSKGGFSLVTNQMIRQEEVRNITLVLPGPQKSYHRVSLIAECVWCQSSNKQRSRQDNNTRKGPPDNASSDQVPEGYAAGFQLREDRRAGPGCP